MLVLTRKVNETIVVGDNVRVVILDIVGDRIRIGIDAPKNMRIVREELLLDTAHANQEALRIASFDFSLKKIDE